MPNLLVRRFQRGHPSGCLRRGRSGARVRPPDGHRRLGRDGQYLPYRGWRRLVFEAWRDAGAGGLYAVMTSDARELRRELEACQQAAVADIAEHR
jgi:hypothetical protein